MPDPELLRAGEVADLLGIKEPNVHRWLRRRGIKPVRKEPHPVGSLYDRAEIEAAKTEWLGARDREADEKRRASALANAEKK